MKRVIAMLFMGSLWSAQAFAQGQPKETICHATGAGTWVSITIAAPAAQNHLANHPNDRRPGETTPDGTATLDDNCVPVPIVTPPTP